MSPELSKKKSAPDLLLRLPPLSESPFVRDEIKFLRHSRSAPSLVTVTKDSPLCQENHKVSNFGGNQPYVTFGKEISPAIGNDSQRQSIDAISAYPMAREPLRNFHNYSNRQALGLSISTSTRALQPLSHYEPSIYDTKRVSRSPRTPNQLSSRCFHAFRRLHPRSVFSTDYRPGTPAPVFTRYSGASISTPTLIFSTALDTLATSVDIKETNKSLESPGDSAMNLLDISCNGKNYIHEPCNYLLQDKESRLAARKHNFNTFGFKKAKLKNQGAVNTPSGSDSEAAKFKKIQSVLVRLWGSKTPESGDASTTTDQQVPSHPLQAHFREAARANESLEQVHQRVEEPVCYGPNKESTTRAKGSRKSKDSFQSGNNFLSDAFAGWETDEFEEAGKELVERIGQGGMAVEDFLESRKIRKSYSGLSPGILPITRLPTRKIGVSWNKSAQEYTGSLGHVSHSGERFISDTFRSGSSVFSKSGITGAGLPTLASLKNKMEIEDTTLGEDWDVAMRTIRELSKEETKLEETKPEETSKKEPKLRRAGTIKLKRDNGGAGIYGTRSTLNYQGVRSEKIVRTRLVELMPEDIKDEDDEGGILEYERE